MALDQLAWRLRWALLAPVVAAVLVALPLILVVVPNQLDFAGRGLPELEAARGRILGWVVLAAALAGLAAVATAWWLRRVLLAPLAEVLAGVERLASGDLDFRLTTPRAPDVALLASTVNRLAERFGAEVSRQAETADEFREILDALPEGVLVVRDGGQVLAVNRAFYQLLRTGSVLADAPVFEAVRHPAVRDLVARASQSADVVAQTLEVDDAVGVRRHLTARGRRLPRRDAVVVVIRDVTDAVRLEAMRRDLVANLSHELKTPLAAVRGYAESLEDGALDDRQLATRFLAGIVTNCRRLEALLADLLTLARMESLDVTEVLEPVDLDELVQDIVDDAAPRLETSGLRLELDLAAPASLLGDRKALERMVSNLVENAIAYNRPGGFVAVRLLQHESHFELVVEDGGIGIPTAAQARIFERFYRVDGSRVRSEGGTGLGLAIVKHAAQRHGGRVEVSSCEGRGSRFTVILPRLRRRRDA